MNFDDKRILITGGGSGIGRALAIGLAAEGARILIAGRRREPLEEVARGTFAIETVAANIATPSGHAAIVDAIEQHFGQLDVLINNAGIQNTTDFAACPPAEDLAERVKDEVVTNLMAPILLTAALLPLMARPGTVVNVTSVLAIQPKASAPVYCATKAGLRSFTLALRHQLHDSGVKVVEVLPPLVDTAMTAQNPHDKISADDCAAEIIDGLEKNRDLIAVGRARHFLLLNRILPRVAARIMIGN